MAEETTPAPPTSPHAAPLTGTQPTPSSGNPYRQLFDLMRGKRLRYLAALVALALATGLDYFVPVLIAAAVDVVLGSTSGTANQYAVEWLRSLGVSSQSPHTLLIPAALALGVTVAANLLLVLKGYWVATACEGVVRSLRDRLYDRLQRAPLWFHDTLQTGDVVQRCTSDVETLRNFYTTQIVEIARAVMLLVIGLPLLFWLDWRLALAATAVLPPIVVFSFVFFTKVKGRFKEADDAEGLMSAVLQENLTGIRVVRAFNRQQFEIGRFDEKNRTYRDLDRRMVRVMAGFWSTSDGLCFAQILLVVGYGCYSVSQGRISVGELLLFLTAVWRFLWPVREMGRTLTEMGKAVVSVGRVYEVASHPGEGATDSKPAPPTPTSYPAATPGSPPAIEIRGLGFSHGSKRILSDVSLSIPPGKTLALLGPSGSGKTTLISLLLRFYDYTEGSITLGGRELRDIPHDEVRRLFAVVMQEPFLFSRSIRDNIRLGRADFAAVSDDAIVQAATQACVHDSIESFEKKYDTLLGERGVTLSGGQRQRVAIARALLRNSPVLILDDALSAVDTHTEADILRALRPADSAPPTLPSRTTLLIAHRISTLMHADQIAVLEHGRLTQLGTHAELIAAPGLYQKLWHIQTALEEDLRTELGDSSPPLPPPPPPHPPFPTAGLHAPAAAAR